MLSSRGVRLRGSHTYISDISKDFASTYHSFGTTSLWYCVQKLPILNSSQFDKL